MQSPLHLLAAVALSACSAVAAEGQAADQTPEAVWAATKERMAKKDIEGALRHFATDKRAGYRDTFKRIGVDEAMKSIAEAGPITKVYLRADTAEYSFTYNDQGTEITFLIHFLREDGEWRIVDF
jgi:hypothetical protein